MKSVPRELPALMRSTKIQQKAKSSGFDWPDINGAVEKLEEEISELKTAIFENDADSSFEELGDVLFSVVNVSRFLNCDAEESLTSATDKFVDRFSRVEELSEKHNIDMNNTSLEELDKLWDKAKKS